MEKRRVLYLLTFFLILLAVSSCAIQGGAPQGGEKDTKPPVVKSASPAANSTHFSASKIIINFDEFVDLASPYTEILISPPMPTMPNFTTSGRSVVVSLKGIQLQPNTTYTIQFGRSIKDVHEGNILADYKYVFSTGSYVDSMFIAGRIADILRRKLSDNLRVLLYRHTIDSTPFKEKPQYFGRADNTGHFKLTNLPKDSFQLFVVDDKNNNYMIDPEENAGFLSQPLRLDSGLTLKDSIALFPQEKSAFYIKRAKFFKDKITLRFIRPFDSLSTLPASPFYFSKSPSNDSITLWPKADSVFKGRVRFSTFSGSRRADSLADFTSAPASGDKLNVMVGASEQNANLYGTPIIVNFNRPVAKINPARIILIKDSTPVPAAGLKVRFADSAHLNAGIYGDFSEESSYKLTLQAGAFTALDKRTNDTIKTSFVLPQRKNFGYLEITATPVSTSPCIFDILKPDGSVLFDFLLTGPRTIALPYMPPGDYLMRMSIDRNRNGRWDSGDILHRLQPEEMRYSAPLRVKSNWEMTGIRFEPFK